MGMKCAERVSITLLASHNLMSIPHTQFQLIVSCQFGTRHACGQRCGQSSHVPKCADASAVRTFGPSAHHVIWRCFSLIFLVHCNYANILTMMKSSILVLSVFATANAEFQGAALRRRLSYEKIAGYAPGSQVSASFYHTNTSFISVSTNLHAFYSFYTTGD
jgi:hypothetical protein